MTDQPIAVIAELRFKTESVQQGLQLIKEIMEPSRKDHGCVYYHFHRSPEDPTCFIFVEQWSTKSSWEDHMEAPHLKKIKDRLEPILAEPIKMRWFNLVY